MAEKLLVRSAVPKFLARQHLTVADLVRRMEDGGFHVDKKTIYRLASDAPRPASRRNSNGLMRTPRRGWTS